jgi:exonuclease III
MNNAAQQEDIKQVVSSIRPDVICIQETKIAHVTPAIINSTLGLEYDDSFVYLLAKGTRGGILCAGRSSHIQLQNPIIKNHSITVQVYDSRHNST